MPCGRDNEPTGSDSAAWQQAQQHLVPCPEVGWRLVCKAHCKTQGIQG